MEGIFDREEPNMWSAAEKMSMAHSAAMVQKLLMRIESLEHWGMSDFSMMSTSSNFSPAQPSLPVIPRTGTMGVR